MEKKGRGMEPGTGMEMGKQGMGMMKEMMGGMPPMMEK